ncbi:hypothetical protein ACP70R_019636 [Stipagrostis hirtigluma subsp. patula]
MDKSSRKEHVISAPFGGGTSLRLGTCIDNVATERQQARGGRPKHGVIVFMSAELRDQAMFGETVAFFRVKGHDMWVQVYAPPC